MRNLHTAKARTGLTVQVWWGDRLIDQRFVEAVPLVDDGLRVELGSASRPDRVRADPLSALRDFAVPVALLSCLIAALVVAVVPLGRDELDGTDLGSGRSEAGSSGRSARPVQLWALRASAPTVKPPREAIIETTFEARRPLEPSRVKTPKEKTARELVDELFAGVGLVQTDQRQLEASLQGLRSSGAGVAFAESGLGAGRELQSRNGGAPGSGIAMGIGDLSTRGRAGGAGAYGSGIGLLGGRKDTVIIDVFSKPTVIGSLSPEVIRRVMSMHRSEIRFCYETALNGDPSLAGRVGTRFVIAASGDVASVEIVSSLGNTVLEECLTRRVRSFKFPPVNGGGVVVVNWPWRFAAAGE